MDLLENVGALLPLTSCETTFFDHFQISSAYKHTSSNGIMFSLNWLLAPKHIKICQMGSSTYFCDLWSKRSILGSLGTFLPIYGQFSTFNHFLTTWGDRKPPEDQWPCKKTTFLLFYHWCQWEIPLYNAKVMYYQSIWGTFHTRVSIAKAYNYYLACGINVHILIIHLNQTNQPTACNFILNYSTSKCTKWALICKGPWIWCLRYSL